MFNKAELAILKKSRHKNQNELFTWNFVNIGIPIFVIIFTLIIVAFNAYNKSDSILGNDFFLTLFNGSLPLTAINLLLLGVFSYLKYNKEREKRYGIETENLRVKLYAITFILLFICLGVYISQALLTPIDDKLLRYLEIGGSAILIYCAYYLSNHLLVLQENFLDKAFEGLNIKGEANLHETTQSSSLLLKRK